MGLGAGIVRTFCRGPHYRGKIRIARWLAERFLPEKGLEHTLADGTTLNLHPRDWIEYRLLQRGNYEPKTLAFLEKNLRPGQQAVLAGVNIGLHVIAAARAVGAEGKVVGVEPQPASLLRARDNIMLNKLPDNIFLVSGALSPNPAILPMDPAPAHNSGMASFIGQEKSSCPFRIIAEPLPEMLYRLGLRRPDFMLLDVEGFEEEVLQGFTPSSRPRILVMEVNEDHLARAGSSEQKIYGKLADLRYKSFDLTGKPATANQPVEEFNVVAIADDAGEVNWV